MSHYVRFGVALLFSAALIYGDLYLAAFDGVRGGLSWVLVPFRAAATLPADGYVGMRDYMRGREALLAEKEDLEERLRESEVRLKDRYHYLRENAELRRLLDLQERLEGGWLAAEVVRGGPRGVFLNKGIADGVVPGMAVVDDAGVLGQVIRADVNTCVVGLLTDAGQWMATRSGRSNVLVILRGDGEGRMAIEYVANDADLREGDRLYADGGLFPPGYPVAVVESLQPGVVYMEGAAKPLTDFSKGGFALLYTSGAAEEEADEGGAVGAAGAAGDGDGG